MVSATGFRFTARTKAAARSITCMELEEVECFDWLATDFTVVGYERKFGHMSVRIMFRGTQPDELGVIFDTAGIQLTNEQIMQTILNGVPQVENPENLIGNNTPVHLYVKTVDWAMRDAEGKVWPFDHILVDTSMTMTKTVNGVQMHRYKGGGKDYAIATADANVGKLGGKFVMVRNEDDTTSVYLTF